MILSVLLAASVAAPVLPNGYEKARWGMTVQELQEVASVERVLTGKGFNYAEHMEEDPEVYAGFSAGHNRIEYYFFEGKLYKVFIIYDKMLYHTKFYEKLVKDTTEKYGPPGRTYEETFYDLVIHHSLWEDPESELDLRKGAGFVYQVRIDRDAAGRKAAREKKKKGV